MKKLFTMTGIILTLGILLALIGCRRDNCINYETKYGTYKIINNSGNVDNEMKYDAVQLMKLLKDLGTVETCETGYDEKNDCEYVILNMCNGNVIEMDAANVHSANLFVSYKLNGDESTEDELHKIIFGEV